MDMSAFDRNAASKELRATRSLALAALSSGLLVIVGVVSVVMGDFSTGTALGVVLFIVLQVVLGLLGFGVGRRGAEHGRVPFSEWEALFAARRELTLQRAQTLLDEVALAPGPVRAHANAS